MKINTSNYRTSIANEYFKAEQTLFQTDFDEDLFKVVFCLDSRLENQLLTEDELDDLYATFKNESKDWEESENTKEDAYREVTGTKLPSFTSLNINE